MLILISGKQTKRLECQVINIMLIIFGKVFILAYLFMFQFSYRVGYSCTYRGSTVKVVYVV